MYTVRRKFLSNSWGNKKCINCWSKRYYTKYISQSHGNREEMEGFYFKAEDVSKRGMPTHVREYFTMIDTTTVHL